MNLKILLLITSCLSLYALDNDRPNPKMYEICAKKFVNQFARCQLEALENFKNLNNPPVEIARCLHREGVPSTALNPLYGSFMCQAMSMLEYLEIKQTKIDQENI